MRPFVYLAHVLGQKVTLEGSIVSWGAGYGTVGAVSREEAIGKTLESAQRLRHDLVTNRTVDALVLELSKESLLEMLEHARPQSEIDAERAAKGAALQS